MGTPVTFIRRPPPYDMTKVTQTDCFKNNLFLLRILGVWPRNKNGEIMENYFIYSYAFRSFFVFLYITLLTINLLTISTAITVLIDECVFYFAEIMVLSKVLLIYGMHGRIMVVLDMLNGEMFSPESANATDLIDKAMEFNVRYWKVIATISIISSITHLGVPLFSYIIWGTNLSMPISSYEFLDEETIEQFAWPLYLYQSLGITSHMLYNVNVDTFIIGLLITVIAQLDILDDNLRNIDAENDADVGWAFGECSNQDGKFNSEVRSTKKTLSSVSVGGTSTIEKLNHCIRHYQIIACYCEAIQNAFSLLLFIQFGLSAIIVCVCLFRLTLESTARYYLFMITYLFIILIQTLMPCWFGTDIILKSSSLGLAAYSSGWVGAGPRLAAHLRLLSTRTARPLAIVAGKMFPLSLQTFGTIMNTAYSYFTLLRNVQMQEIETDSGRL